ncbi:MAG TPA: hypothetical protein VJV78_11490 [Polyangiales bacterium]|nr:hypothetical protein [Polyangiales bacterium]
MSDPAGARLVLARSTSNAPWVGQMVPIDVALWRPWSGKGELPAFSLDEPEVPDAIALFRRDAPPPSQVTQDGVLYLVQHRTLLVFPQQDGEIVVPPLRARFDDPAPGRPVRVSSPPLQFTAAMPRNLEREGSLLVAHAVQVEEKLDRSLHGLKVGDGFTRSIVLTARYTDPIMLPELRFEPVEGLQVYPAEPRVLATGERGAIEASRSYSATYVVERVGHYELPELSLRWLDPASGRYTTARAESLSFWTRPNPSLGLDAFGSVPGLGASILLATLILLGALAYVIQRRLRGGPFAWEQRLRARNVERRAFFAFERALTHAPPFTRLSRAYAWLALRSPAAPRTLERLRAASKESAQALSTWEAQAFGGRAHGESPRGLLRVFVRARRGLGEASESDSVCDINPSRES